MPKDCDVEHESERDFGVGKTADLAGLSDLVPSGEGCLAALASAGHHEEAEPLVAREELELVMEAKWHGGQDREADDS